jgi:hypothetical protein
VLGAAAADLLEAARLGGRAVRLTGVSTTGLVRASEGEQLAFDEGSRARGEALGHALDRIQQKYGRDAVQRAVHVEGRDTVRGVAHRDEEGGG